MVARRFVVVVSAAALLLTGGPLVMSTPGVSPPAVAEDGSSGSVFVNEIHYANAGVDVGEFVEIAGPSETDVSGYEVVLYDGETGAPYETTPLTQLLDPNGTLVVDYPVEGVQDGPDAVALVHAGEVADFVSYGGEVSATSGPADGMTSVDTGVLESEDTPADASIQVVGTGGAAVSFDWAGPREGSPGILNEGQTLTTLDIDPEDLPGLVTDATEPGEVIDQLVRPSDPANEVLIEGESMVPTAVGTPVIDQDSTGALIWSGDQQLRINGAERYDSTTMTFQLPSDGRWDLSVDMTTGANFGLAEIKIDDAVVGTFDGLGVTPNTLVRRHGLGQHDLAAGSHTITLTATEARNNQFRIGLDLMRWRLQPVESRLTLTPWRGDATQGSVPVFGWSSDPADTLRLEVDHEDVSDWHAIGDTATLVYQGRDIQAGPGDPEVGIVVRGKKLVLGHDVINRTSPVTGFATDGFQISGELLHPGLNEIRLLAGAEDDPVDEFDVRNLRLQLADGTHVDPTKPATTIYHLGSATRERVWTFTIPTVGSSGAHYTLARGFELDSSLLTDGDHSVILRAAGPAGTETLVQRFSVDNGRPEVSDLSPGSGSTVKGRFLLDATVTDETDSRPTIDARLDGSSVQLGDTLNTDDLVDGRHSFSVVVTDAAGNYDEAATTFVSVGETPDAPQLLGPLDGSAGLGTQADLSVTATDPSGEKLHVDFLQATQSGPPVAGRSGSTDGDVPAPAADAGTAVDPAAVASSDDTYLTSDPSGDTPYQRYDLKVSRVRGAKYVDLSWEGKVAADRDAVLSVWDVGLQSWKEVVSSRGTDAGDTTLVGMTRLGPAIDGDVVHVLVEARDPFAPVPSTPDEAFKNPDDYQLALAWMTDTQYLSQGAVEPPAPTPLPGPDVYSDTYREMARWIQDNATLRHIEYTAHTGDVINKWQVTSLDESKARAEFDFASKTMAILDDGLMPNGVLPGNHDNKTGANNNLYNEYFGPSRYEALSAVAPKGDDGEGFYGGPWQPDDNQNHYDLVEAHGVKLILLHLGYLVKDDEIAWANQVLAKHRDRAAVLLTHSYLLPSRAPDAMGSELTTQDGRDLFDKVVIPNHNVFLTLSGHVHGMGVNIKRDVGVKGRTVVEMVANTQFFEIKDARRLGYLRLLQLDPDRGELTVDTYSPYDDDFNTIEWDTQVGRKYTAAADEFVVPVDIPTRKTALQTDTIGMAVRGTTVIGSADVASGGTASVTWKGLTTGTRYGWYARATDPTGATAESSVFSFVTAAAKQ